MKETFYILYETTNLINGKKYRGIHKTFKLEDGYIGSGVAFEFAVKKYGKKSFNREILEFCNSYDELLHLEKIYVDEDWVNDKSNYNLKTGGQSSGILSEESKSKISETLKNAYENGYINPMKGKNREIVDDKRKESISNTLKEHWKNIPHNRIGIKPWNKGLKGVIEPWNKGLKMEPMTDEEKEKRSKSLKEYFENHPHPSIGLEPWNKGKKGLQKNPNKGKVMVKTECPHCSKLVDVANGKRWHFDNCKLKYEEN
jgi:hypothetical protein